MRQLLIFCLTALMCFSPELAKGESMEGERIFFIRKRTVGGLLLGDIYSMNPDGSDVRRITNFSDSYAMTELPQISRDGKSLAFISNYESWKSSFYLDAFVFDLQSGAARRITGFEQKTPATEFGTVSVTVEDKQGWAVSPSAIRISHKGCSEFISGNSASLKVPANEDVWVKAELAKAKGDLKIVRVAAGERVSVKLDLQAGSLSAEHVCPSNDGSLLAVATNTENVNFPYYTIAFWGTQSQEMLAEVTGQRQGGDTHPAISPDGSKLAFCTGQHTLNSLAIIPMNKLEATPEILVPGSSFGVQAFCAQPSWSPDGSEIAFVYTSIVTSLAGTELQSNLYTVSVNGGDPIQITSVSGNEMVSRPSYSPDGKSIAFSMLKSSGKVFLLSDLINFTYSSDIYAISAKKSGAAKGLSTPVAITNDGKSIDPSWGMVKNTVGLPGMQETGACFKLIQTYPNPFSAATQIDFHLPEPAFIRMEVCDILGRLISVLVDDFISEGSHQISWAGRDMFGHLVPEGIYFCTMKAPGFTSSRRMVLQR